MSLYCPQEILSIDRFFQVVNGSHLHCFEVRGRVPMPSQHQDWHVPVSCHGKLQDELPFKGRTALVHNDHVKILALQGSRAFFIGTAGTNHKSPTTKVLSVPFAIVGFRIDQQDSERRSQREPGRDELMGP